MDCGVLFEGFCAGIIRISLYVFSVFAAQEPYTRISSYLQGTTQSYFRQGLGALVQYSLASPNCSRRLRLQESPLQKSGKTVESHE